ncbi:DUF2270 domain-containing protein [Halorussus halophilus]|uniref:DUF2270 domain-containing protein n=1 Tax=Halorussus halophilus TaxID=2650975 RepID=UPI001CE4B331|nr:DUF2270 domain-containing protein [Halorussus halophilus]
MKPEETDESEHQTTPDESPDDENKPPDDEEGPTDDEDQPTDEVQRDAAPPPGAEVGKGLLDEAMGPSSSMAHLYRGEIHRMKLWRERLDKTTNWAVIVMAGVLTWSFSSEQNPHYVILAGIAAVGLFLTIEARRYRAYDIWRSRVRKMQENVWAFGLDPSQGLEDEYWRPKLSRDYRKPTLKITAEEAISHRLRRVYLPLFTLLLGAWAIRIVAFTDASWPASAAIGDIPGLLVTGVVASLYTAAVVVACRPRTWHARGELRTEDLRKYE